MKNPIVFFLYFLQNIGIIVNVNEQSRPSLDAYAKHMKISFNMPSFQIWVLSFDKQITVSVYSRIVFS